VLSNSNNLFVVFREKRKTNRKELPRHVALHLLHDAKQYSFLPHSVLAQTFGPCLQLLQTINISIMLKY